MVILGDFFGYGVAIENPILILFVISIIITIASLYFMMQENEEYKIIFDKHKKIMLWQN